MLAEARDVATLIVCRGEDGAPLGGIGATVAARTLADCADAWNVAVGRRPERGTVAGWLLLARDRIRSIAAERGVVPADLATTAIIVTSDGEKTDVCHLGRGAVLARSAATGEWGALSAAYPDAAAGSTAFLADEGTSAMRWQRREEELDALVIVTGSVERYAIDARSGTPRATFLEPLFAPSFAKTSFGYSPSLSAALSGRLGDGVVDASHPDAASILLAYRPHDAARPQSPRWRGRSGGGTWTAD